MVGIVGYGTHFAALDERHGCADQDGITLSVEATRKAIAHGLDVVPERIGAVFVGAYPPILRPRPAAADVAQAVSVAVNCHCVDLHQGPDSASAALFAAYNAVKPSAVQIALALGADAVEAGVRPDGLAAAAAVLIGRVEVDIVASLDSHLARRIPVPTTSRDGVEPYAHALSKLVKETLTRKRLQPADFAHVVFRTAHGAADHAALLSLGFVPAQFEAAAFGAQWPGDSGAQPLLSLCAALDVAQPGERVLMCSYTNGLGAEASVFTATEQILSKRRCERTVRGEYEFRRRQLHERRSIEREVTPHA